jgi:hypothetical protein
MSILKDLLKGVLASKVPTVIQSGYCKGEKVEYIDRSIRPVHRGTIVGTWNNRVKVTFEGFEFGVWLEEEEVRRV